jgi:hypothetical protein
MSPSKRITPSLLHFHQEAIYKDWWLLERLISKSLGLVCCLRSGKKRKKECLCSGFGSGFSGCQRSFRNSQSCGLLGSMFGATQTVDMISSLKRSYGRVEVAVLNVDLLPNSIDTVVIGDRIFSLSIQVEGVMGNEVHNNPMDVDEGNPGAVNSGGGQSSDGTNNVPRGSGAGQESEENWFKEPQHSTAMEDKPTKEVHGVSHDQVEVSKSAQGDGQDKTVVSSQSKGVLIEHEVSSTGMKDTNGGMQNVTTKSHKTVHKHVNSLTNLNWPNNKQNDATYKLDIIACDLSPHAALGS